VVILQVNIDRIGAVPTEGDAPVARHPNRPSFSAVQSVEVKAGLLGISRQALHAILTERAAITPLMALKLGKLCGNGPDLWMNLQVRYDLARLGEAKRGEIAAVPTLNAA
jgi:addiction module HigA family antidote